jgi:hypothetical protein
VKVVQLRITPAPTAVTSLTAPSATAALLANAGADPRKATFTVQARGSYGALKQWLGQTMQLQPWAVVDKLEWRLSDAGSGEIDAQIIWGVYVQD